MIHPIDRALGSLTRRRALATGLAGGEGPKLLDTVIQCSESDNNQHILYYVLGQRWCTQHCGVWGGGDS